MKIHRGGVVIRLILSAKLEEMIGFCFFVSDFEKISQPSGFRDVRFRWGKNNFIVELRNMKKRDRRRQFISDPKLQGLLCLRDLCYLVACQLSMVAATLVMTLLMDGTSHNGSSAIWQLVIPALVVSTLVVPIALLDLLFFSNRIAGPLLNFRKKLQQLIENEAAEKIRIRQDDFCWELCEQLNRLRVKFLAKAHRPSDVTNSTDLRKELAVTQTRRFEI